MAERYTLGPNSLVVEGDTLFLTSVGPFELAAAQQYSQVAERVIREHGAVYFVTDLRAAALMPAETRRYFAQWATRFAAKAIIYYGASLPLRAVATLLLSAARLLGNHQRAFELFVQTEQEARAALAEFKRSQVPRSSDTKE